MTNQERWQIDFGIRLRAERERKGMTRSALAKLAYTEQGYIVQLERGDRSPSLRTFINLLSALETSADSLIFGTTAAQRGNMDVILNDFTDFLSTRSVEEVRVLFEIVRLIARYRDIDNND